jgi:hypothetical protein
MGWSLLADWLRQEGDGRAVTLLPDQQRPEPRLHEVPIRTQCFGEVLSASKSTASLVHISRQPETKDSSARAASWY